MGLSIWLKSSKSLLKQFQFIEKFIFRISVFFIISKIFYFGWYCSSEDELNFEILSINGLLGSFY